MPFDLYAPLFDAAGRGSRAAIEAWEEELLALFVASPEARSFNCDGGWVEIVLELALAECEVLAPDIDASDLARVLGDSFPVRVMCRPADAAEIFDELRAFWAFLHREFALSTAPACLALLADPGAFAVGLGDPSRYGSGKTRLLRGAR